jgi:hypothetical protein
VHMLPRNRFAPMPPATLGSTAEVAHRMVPRFPRLSARPRPDDFVIPRARTRGGVLESAPSGRGRWGRCERGVARDGYPSVSFPDRDRRADSDRNRKPVLHPNCTSATTNTNAAA